MSLPTGSSDTSELPTGAPAPRRLVADTGKMSAATAVSYFVNLLGGLVLARLLAPSLFGVWKTVQMAVDFATLSNLGSLNGFDRVAPALVSRGKMRRYQSLLAATMGFSLAIDLALAAVALIVMAITPDTLNRIGLATLAAVLVLLPVYTHGEAVLNAEKRFGAKARVIFAQTVGRIVLSILAAWQLGLPGVMIVYVLSVALSAWYMFSHSQARPAHAWRWPAVRGLIAGGLPVTFLGAGERLLLNADRIVVVAVLGSTSMGVYQMAVFALPLLMLAPSSLRQVVTTEIYDRHGRTGTLASCRDVYERSVSTIALSSPLLMGGVYFGVPPLIALFLEAYVPAIPALKLFSIGAYPLLMMQMCFVIVIVARRTLGAFAWLLGVSAASAAASFVLLRHGHCIESVLAAHSAGWLVLAVVTLARIESWMGATARETATTLAGWFAPMAWVGCGVVAIDWTLRRAGLGGDTIPWGIAGGLLHILASAPLLWLLEKRTGGASYFARAIRRRLGIAP